MDHNIDESSRSGVGAFAVKLELDDTLISQNGLLDKKIFTLIPDNIRNVRSLKNIVKSKFKIKTPFNLYNGDYRIFDNEDVKIITLSDQPIRLVAVIPDQNLGKSGASTPTPSWSQQTQPEARNVHFHFSPSATNSPSTPLARAKGSKSAENSGFDQLDGSNFVKTPFACSTPASKYDDNNSDDDEDENSKSLSENDSSGGKNKRKRQRKRKNVNRDQTPDVDDISATNTNVHDDSEFKAPLREPLMKRINTLSGQNNFSEGKRRPDTPRVVKHPNFNKLFHISGCGNGSQNNADTSFEDLCGGYAYPHKNGNGGQEYQNQNRSTRVQKPESRGYDSFPPVTSIEGLGECSIIAFKKLILDSTNSPVLSDFVEALVQQIEGTKIYLDYRMIPHVEGNEMHDLENGENLNFPSVLSFQEMVDVRLVPC